MKEIDPDLHSLQAEVGGDIGATYPYSDPVALVCNDEGKLIGLDLNRGLRDDRWRYQQRQTRRRIGKSPGVRRSDNAGEAFHP